MKMERIVRFALGSLLTLGMGCGSDLLEPDSKDGFQRPTTEEDDREGDPSAQPLQSPSPSSSRDAGLHVGRKDAGVPAPDEESCAPPGEPTDAGVPGQKDAGVHPGRPRDAGVPSKPADAGTFPGDIATVCTTLTVLTKQCTGYDDVRHLAAAYCSNQGLNVGEVHFKDDPACKGGTSELSVSCCFNQDIVDPPPVVSCSGGVIGDGTTCIDHGTLKARATHECAIDKSTLTNLWTDNSCEGGATLAKYECCQSQVIDPPVPACSYGVIGDGSECLDPDAIKQRASAACAAAKSTLTNFWPDETSCAGGSSLAKYECCPTPGYPEKFSGI